VVAQDDDAATVRRLVFHARLIIDADPEAAREDIDGALELDPKDAEAHYVLGRLRERAGDIDEAEAEFMLAAELRGGYAEPHVARGELHLGRDEPRLGAARRAFAKALAIEPDHVDALYGLAQVCLSTGEAQQARDLLQRVLNASPEHARARLDLGMELYAAGALDEARSHLELAAAEEEADPLPFFALGLVYDALDQPEKALEAYDAALAIDPDYAAALYNKAVVLESADRADEALAVLRHLQSVDPSSSDAAARAARILDSLGRDTELIAKLRQLAALQPENTDVRLRLAKAYLAQGKTRDAMRQFDRVLEADPESMPALRALALVAEQTGDLPGAESHYRGMARIEPEALDHKRSLSRVLLKLDRSEEALQIARAAAADPADLGGRRFLIQVLTTCGQQEEAVREAHALLAIVPDDLATLTFAASVLAGLGRTGEALSLYQRAVEADPENPSLRCDYARALEDARKFGRAAEEYGLVPAGSPSYGAAREGILRCLAASGDVMALADALEAASSEDQSDLGLAMRAAEALVEARQVDRAREAAVRAVNASSSAEELEGALRLVEKLGATAAALEVLRQRYTDAPSPRLATRIASLLPPGPAARRWALTALRTSGDDADAAAEAVLALMAAGDVDEAAREADALADRFTDSAAVFVALGRIYERLGDLATAASHFRRALALDRESAEAKEGLAQCGG